MKRLAAAFLLLALSAPSLADDPEARARALITELDDLWRGKSSHGVLTMNVKTANYSRSMKMEAWSKGTERSLVKIEAPVREKGTASLKSGNSLYTYLPKTNRTIRMTSAMMGSSWMGSHFTNDDLMKESRLLDDYVPTITFEGERDGTEIIELTLMPKPDAPVVWGKIVSVLDAKQRLPIVQTYFDEDQKIARKMTHTAVKTMSGRTLPTVMRIVPSDKPEEFTEMVYESLEFDVDLPDSFFSISKLRRR